LNDFYLWFSTGLEHIADWKGYDHILFIWALCGMYSIRQWKKLLVLVTAFTLGHSLTLALSVLDIFTVRSAIVEVLIPVTIILTCILNLYQLDRSLEQRLGLRYVSALVFGLVHGLGFSYLLKSLLGTEENITSPLLAFNIGLEAGQLLILGFILIVGTVFSRFFKIVERDRRFFIAAVVLGMALVLLLERVSAFNI
jgi:HupE / UreJ protein